RAGGERAAVGVDEARLDAGRSEFDAERRRLTHASRPPRRSGLCSMFTLTNNPGGVNSAPPAAASAPLRCVENAGVVEHDAPASGRRREDTPEISCIFD